MVKAFDADQPISTPDEDLLGRRAFAKKVATVLARPKKEDPLVVGLYGQWGSGKTSILNMVDVELRQILNVVVVSFNPWYFSGELNLLEKFFEEIAAAMGGKPGPLREQVAGALRKYLSVLKPAMKVVTVVSDVVAPGSGVVMRGLVDVAGNAINKVTEAGDATAEFLKREVSIAEVRNDVRERLRESGLRVVVVIDDMDRLEPVDMRAVLKIVRLVGDLPCVSYILSFDPDVVARALATGWGEAGATKKGREYLEKIVQVEIPLPRLRKEEIRRIALDGIGEVLKDYSIELSEEESRRLVGGWVGGVQVGVDTIRQVKRVLSSIGFAVGLLRDEVDVPDLILMEALRVVYPELFGAIRDEPERVLRTGRFGGRSREERREGMVGLVDVQLEKLPPAVKDGVAELVESLFPMFDDAFDASSGYRAKLRQQKRVASAEYLEKVLGYGVPAGIVSDVMYSEVVGLAGAGKRDDFLRALSVLADGSGWEELIRRFQHDWVGWSLMTAYEVALAVVMSSSSLRVSDSVLGVSPSRDGAFFVSKVLWGLRGDGEVRSKAQQLVLKSESLYFAGLVAQWLEESGARSATVEVGGANAELWGEVVADVKRFFCDRVGRELDLLTAIGGAKSREALAVAGFWKAWAGQGVFDVAVNGCIERDPAFVERLLVAIFPFIPEDDLDNSIKWEMDVDGAYRYLCSFVSAVRVARCLGGDVDGVGARLVNYGGLRGLSRVGQARLLFLDLYSRGLVGE